MTVRREDPVLHGLGGADSVGDHRFLDRFEVPDRHTGSAFNPRKAGRVIGKENLRGTAQCPGNARTVGLAKGGVGDRQGNPGGDEPLGNATVQTARRVWTKVSGTSTDSGERSVDTSGGDAPGLNGVAMACAPAIPNGPCMTDWTWSLTSPAMTTASRATSSLRSNCSPALVSDASIIRRCYYPEPEMLS